MKHITSSKAWKSICETGEHGCGVSKNSGAPEGYSSSGKKHCESSALIFNTSSWRILRREIRTSVKTYLCKAILSIVQLSSPWTRYPRYSHSISPFNPNYSCHSLKTKPSYPSYLDSTANSRSLPSLDMITIHHHKWPSHKVSEHRNTIVVCFL